MIANNLPEKAATYLHKLCRDIPSRRVGSAGNRAATDFFAGIVASFGFEVETPAFDCIDWRQAGVDLRVGDRPFQAFPSPYSLGCAVRAPLVVVATVAELEAAEIADRVVLLRGDIAAHQVMPKNFPFYNPEAHQHIIRLLETGRPRAIIAATSRDAEMVGSLYPFPLFEDGDFDIPSVYMTDTEGERLAQHAGEAVALTSRAERIPATGCNVEARKGADAARRVVFFAHIDAKMGTPGALDNASGVTVLLLLVELLAGYAGNLRIEIVALNGEDYYSSPGEQLYLARNAGQFGGIVLGVNIDGVGYRKGKVAYSLYGCPDALASTVRAAFAAYPATVEGEPWYQGDHGLFLMHETPTLALTSERAAELLSEIVHTPQDTPDLIDVQKLADTATALRDLLLRLDAPPA